MAVTVHVSSGNSRFKTLLRGEGFATHDKPLLEQPTWLVAPTLGAIIPNWLLAVPRKQTLNFRDWAASGGEGPQAVLEVICGHLGLASDEVIWFEHGPAASGTVVGCGLDHAHLHVLVRPSFHFGAFVDAACAHANLSWQEQAADSAYDALESGASYYIAGSGNRAVSTSHVDLVGSQFFRRVVSALTDDTSAWDYRYFPHTRNIDITVETFRSLESAARRER